MHGVKQKPTAANVSSRNIKTAKIASGVSGSDKEYACWCNEDPNQKQVNTTVPADAPEGTKCEWTLLRCLERRAATKVTKDAWVKSPN